MKICEMRVISCIQDDLGFLEVLKKAKAILGFRKIKNEIKEKSSYLIFSLFNVLTHCTYAKTRYRSLFENMINQVLIQIEHILLVILR